MAREYGSPCVVGGFEPIDALMGIYMLVRQLEEGRQAIEIEYDRVVTWDGNKKAQEIMDSVFEPGDSLWRGIGNIPGSGLRIKDGFSEFDAERKFSIPRGKDEEPKGCMCGSVLKGLMTPDKCPLFARACTPEFPIGPCMVSSEGTCAAFFKYRKVA